MWRLFRRRPKDWAAGSDHRKRRDLELKRNPGRLEHELEQATQWAVRVAEKKLHENSHRSNEKET
ncbi:MAG TPA: hypothetical protein VEM96_14805 [Pyrinomonadaceae bacterium]|nr:hypothetical protein [Pyrinomonadaceae bacterium]